METPRYVTDERQGLSAATTISLAAMTIIAALYLAWPIWRATLPLEIDSNEPWIAYHADAVRAGQRLYPDPDGLLSNNYPPLSFYLIAAVSAANLDAVMAGRMLSLLSTAAIAIAVAICVRQFGGSRAAAFLAAVWFLATMARFFTGYMGMNDPHLLALAIMTSALAWFLYCLQHKLALEYAILLMVAAGFFKHTLFAIPAAALCWLALCDRRAAMRAALVGCAAAAFGLALCGAFYGGAFFRQLFMPRQYSLLQALASLGRLQWIAPALGIFAVWAWHERQSQAVRFISLFAAIAFVLHFLQRLGAGVDDNVQFELAVGTAIGLGLAFDGIGSIPSVRRWGVDRGRITIVLILMVRLLASDCTSPYLLIASSEFRTAFQRHVAAMNAETARIAAIPGPVVCPALTICRRAGKPFVYDAFAVEQRIKTGKMTQEELDRRIREQGIRFEPIDPEAVIQWR